MAADGLIGEVRSEGAVRILNCLPSQETEKDWRIRHAVAAGLVKAPAAVPTSRDLRDDSWWGVADQGSTGSCVGWALTDSVLRWHFVTEGRLSRNERLSPRFAWMAAKETDEFTSEPSTFIERAGTSLKAALDVARQHGSVRETVLPFGSAVLFDGDVNTFFAIAAQLKIVAYVNLGRDVQDWRRWLALSGPVLVRLNVDRSWDQATRSAGDLDGYEAATARGGHAAALVGYTEQRLVVRNSWGAAWGDRGYAYASEQYAAAAFTEAYGVTVGPAGPPRIDRPAWRR
ncbi:MAG TPA: C1 family peptidase [Mycobacteriales bacterium]